MTGQSKRLSLIEAMANVAIGYGWAGVVAVAIGVLAGWV